MIRTLVGMALALVLLGCGSEGTSDTGAEADTSEPSQTEAPTYFVEKDTATINVLAAAAQKATTRARADAAIDRCNQATEQGIAAYRTCLHDLLDPAQAKLTALAAGLSKLADQELPPACVTELSRASDAFSALGEQVGALLKGIESPQRAAQMKTARTYVATVDRVNQGYAGPFEQMTKVCYSPEDLAKITASPTPSD